MQNIINDSDRHQIYLGKLTSHLLDGNVYPSMAEAFKAASRIVEEFDGVDSPKSMNSIQGKISADVEPIFLSGLEGLTAGLYAMAEYEAEFAANLFGKHAEAELKVPTPKAVRGAIDRAQMTVTSGQRTTSYLWPDYIQRNASVSAEAYNGIVASAYQNGLTVSEIKKQLKDVTNGLLKGNAEALARTGQCHFATTARESMAQNNLDVLKYRVFTATFDNRTTLQCRANNGKKFKITDEKYPHLPLHWNERSVYVYTVDEEDLSGTRSSVGGNETDEINPKRKLKYRGKKDTDIFNPGQIDVGISQTEWLKAQPDWFQESALGEKRAKLLRDGGLSVERFVDMLGKPIPLNKLRELDAEAFRRAGL